MRDGREGGTVIGPAVGLVILLVAVAGGLAATVLALGLGEREPLELQIAGLANEGRAAAEPGADPLAWNPGRRDFFEERAALGSSHVIYEMSPGGVVASAKRTARFRGEIEAAAGRHGLDPDLLEAVIFLESAGRPWVIAGPTPESASGLAQIIPSTATELLGMHVDLPASIELTRKIVHSKSARETERLRARRAAIDERFDAAKAIEGAARYLEIARQRFGAEDLAVESYHMGIGNLEGVVRSYLGGESQSSVRDLVEADALSFAQIYFDSSPSRHREAYELLTGFGDESADYLWKVRASEQIMGAWRDDSEALQDYADLATNKATLEEVFHPENETDVFEDPGEIEEALARAQLVTLPHSRKLGWVADKHMGELAGELGEDPALYHALRPEALATLSYLAGLVENESGDAEPLRVTSTVRDLSYQELLIASNPEATSEYSLHTTGWAFDILRKYDSRAQAEAFQYVLDRLSALALIDYATEPGAIHVTVSDLGRELVKTGG